MDIWKTINRKITSIISAIILGLIGAYIFYWVHGNERELLEQYWMVLVLIFILIIGIGFYLWKKEKEEEFKKLWKLYKPVKKLAPEDFNIQKYRKAHIHRKSDETIENYIKNGEYVLIIGKPKIGKTRAAYEAIKKLENFSVIKPNDEKINIEEVIIPPLINKNFIVFLDDLNRFINKGVEDIISKLENKLKNRDIISKLENKLKKKNKKLIVVATCRKGEELNDVKNEKKMLEFYRKFKEVELEEITEEEGKELAKNIGINWKEKQKQFDGTPGSVTLDLEDMKNRYKKLNDKEKGILKAIKLLREGWIFSYKKSIVMKVCEEIFRLKIDKYERDEIINNLKEGDFIKEIEDNFEIYDAYMDFCVYDYKPQDDLKDLMNMFIKTEDSERLFYLGNRFYYKRDLENAEKCYLEALKINPNIAEAHVSLGLLLYDLKSYGKAGEEYREAIKINPNYASPHNDLGILLHDLNRYEEAEEEFREALKINPNYAEAHNNLGNLLYDLKSYGKAGEEYREAIKINPNYAEAHNNLGFLFVKLKRYEGVEEEYKKAIKANPNYALAHQNLSELYFVTKKYEKSLEYAEKSLEISREIKYKVISKFLVLINLIALKRECEKEKEEFLNFIRENKGYELIWEFETVKDGIKGLKFEKEILDLIEEIEKFGVRGISHWTFEKSLLKKQGRAKYVKKYKNDPIK